MEKNLKNKKNLKKIIILQIILIVIVILFVIIFFLTRKTDYLPNTEVFFTNTTIIARVLGTG